MNRKGQTGRIGLFVGIFITIIVALILLQASSQELHKVIHTETLAFHDIGAVVANDTNQSLTEWRAINSVTIYNATGHEEIPTHEYTIYNNVVDDGALQVNIMPVNVHENHTNEWRINATGQPTTYDTSSGGRSIAGIIILLTALAVALIALVPVIRENVFK